MSPCRAVTVAYKGKITLALSVALGRAAQIGSMVLPLMVLMAWMAGQPLTMDLQEFQMGTLFASMVALQCCLADNKSHWLKGVILISMYCALAGAFFVHMDTDSR